jgi:hypothetical protein
MCVQDISMKPRHLAHLETHERKAGLDLMVCSARWLVPKSVYMHSWVNSRFIRRRGTDG